MTDDHDSLEVIAEVGGPVDETRVTLALYGEKLNPDEVTKHLGRQPTHAHRKGDRKRPTSSPFKTGGWFLTIEGKAPDGPGDLIARLLHQLPRNGEVWKELRNSYDIQLRVGIHTGGWNRGFDIPPAALALVTTTGASLGFDLYFYGEENDTVDNAR